MFFPLINTLTVYIVNGCYGERSYNAQCILSFKKKEIKNANHRLSSLTLHTHTHITNNTHFKLKQTIIGHLQLFIFAKKNNNKVIVVEKCSFHCIAFPFAYTISLLSVRRRTEINAIY